MDLKQAVEPRGHSGGGRRLVVPGGGGDLRAERPVDPAAVAGLGGAVDRSKKAAGAGFGTGGGKVRGLVEAALLPATEPAPKPKRAPTKTAQGRTKAGAKAAKSDALVARKRAAKPA